MFFVILFGALAGMLWVRLVMCLITGQIRYRYILYRRSQRPRVFWWIVIVLAIAAMLATITLFLLVQQLKPTP